MGKVLLAFLPPFESHQLLSRRPLQKLTPRTITDPKRLEAQFARIRRVGFGENRGENFVGVGSVAAPIRDRSGKVVAAVSNGFVLRSESETKWRELARDLIQCAEAISLRLGVTAANGQLGR
jgi:DNA-binding IclR family transcriptional regulator